MIVKKTILRNDFSTDNLYGVEANVISFPERKQFFTNKLTIMKLTRTTWRTFGGEKILSIKDAVEKAIIRETEAGHRLKVCIGTDSQVRNKVIESATVIVFLRERRGGFMFIHTDRVERKMSLKERMIYEVGKSVDIAYYLCDLLDKYNVALEVHADINTDEKFRSNVALSEAIGYIMGMGFAFKTKPYAFASSACADKIVK